MAMRKPKINRKLLSVSMFLMLISISIMTLLPSAKATTVLNDTMFPSASYAQGWDYYDSSTAPKALIVDESHGVCDGSTYIYNTIHFQSLATGSYTNPDYYPYYWPFQTLPGDNDTITNVWVYVLFKQYSVERHFNLSYSLDSGATWKHDSGAFSTGINPYNYDWNSQGYNVSSFENWTALMVKSSSFRVLLTSYDSADINHALIVDYLGVWYEWIGPYTPPNPFDSNDASLKMNGLAWLLVVFLPALVMSEAVPKIGYYAGIILMLVIMGISQANFLAFMVIGFASIGVSLYKGG